MAVPPGNKDSQNSRDANSRDADLRDAGANITDSVVAEVVVEPDLLVIDVSGVDGRDARDGISYAGSAAPRARDGRPGGDANEPERGESAGAIDLLCTPGDEPGSIVLQGARAIPAKRQEPISERLVIGSQGVVRLLAGGGKGGHGGRGGDGEAGGKGQDGADATQWSRGGDGGPGGDGGNGGDGTRGARGGDGGRVAIQVDQRDTDLLMLFEAHVAGGVGGEVGANGAGGAGGPGGDGGRSCSWTTSRTEYRTDAQGRRQPHTVHDQHHNPGGSDGPAGRPGRDGSAVLMPGTDGLAGQFRILVQERGHTAQYDARYEVEIVDYDLELTDEFAEPTSPLKLTRVRVRNSGGMPTPGAQPSAVYWERSPWVEPGSEQLTLTPPLEPRREFSWEDAILSARVPDLETVPVGDPLRVRERVHPLAFQPRVRRMFANQHVRKEFTVAFAAEMDAVTSLESQVPGRAALMLVQITNRSRQDLGRDSSTGRTLAVRIELRNPEMAAHLMLLDMEGRQVPWTSGYREELTQLAAGTTTTVRTILGVLPGAPGYTRGEVFVTLELGQLHAPAEPRDRHRREYPLRIAQAYALDSTADILLITNHSTTPEELAAWKSAAAVVNQSINVWDISLNDSLSLSDKLVHGQNLLRDFHGKTIVLSNGAFSTVLGERHGDQFLSQMDLIKAAESHNIRVLVLNDENHDLAHVFRERLIPTDGEPEYFYGSEKAFFQAQPWDKDDVLFHQVDELVEHGAKAAQPDPIRQTSEIDLYGIRSPNAKRLQRQATRLQQRLQNRTPGRRVVVVYRMPHELPQAEQEKRTAAGAKGGWFFSHVHQGTLLVMPTLGDTHPNLVVMNATASDIHDPAFLQDTAVRTALVQSLSFEEKVFLLSGKLREIGDAARLDLGSVDRGSVDRGGVDQADVSLAESLVDALLVDLATEQAAILKTGWQPLFFADTIRRGLAQLRLLADHQFALMTGDAEQADVRIAARLLAGIEFLGDYSSRWYESRVLPWGFFRRGPTLRAEILRQHARLRENLLREPNERQRQLLADAYAQYVTECQKLGSEKRLDKRDAARQVLLAPLARSGIHTDAGRPFSSVLSHAEWNQVRSAEADRDAAREQLQAQKEASRTALGVARGGRPVAGVDSQVEKALQPFVAACADAVLRQEALQHEALRRREAARASQYSSAPPVEEPMVSTNQVEAFLDTRKAQH